MRDAKGLKEVQLKNFREQNSAQISAIMWLTTLLTQ